MFNRNNSLEIVILILFAFFAGFICTISAFAQEHGDDFVIGKYLQMNSKILNEERTIVVDLPEGYDKSHASYPVLYVLDADWEDLFTTVVATSGYLNEFGRIPKMIVVGICNTDRTRDMTPVKIKNEQTSGGAAFFLKFISEELMPFIGPYNGLRFIFSEWAFPEDRRAEAGLDEIKQHFSQIAKKYGYKLIIPADILIGLGYRSIRQGKLTEAIEALLFACKLHPYSPDAFYYLGEAYEKNNQIDLALKNYKKALEVDSSYLMAVKKIQSLEKK